MNYEQFEITTIITAANLGTYLGIVPSLIYDALGPRTACVLGSALISTGYAGAYLIAKGILPGHYLYMSLCFFIMGQGSSATYTASLATNVKNFPAKHRGIVTGAMVAAFGFSAAVFSIAFRSIFDGNVLNFFIFMAACGLCIPLVGVLFMTYRWVPEDQHIKEQLREAGHAEGKSLLQPEGDKITPLHKGEVSYGGTEYVQEVTDAETPTPRDIQNNDDIAQSAVSATSEFLSEEDIKQEMDKMVLTHPDSSPFRMVFSLDFALLILGYFPAVGSGLLIINNLGSIVISYGGQDGDQNVPIIVLSLCNCAGRILFGMLSDRFRRWLSRPAWLGLCSFIMAMMMLMFTFIPMMNSMGALPFLLLYLAAVVIGFAYGGLMSLTPSFIGDRYGQTFLGINLNLVLIGPIIGSFLIASWIASFFYQRSVPDDGSNQCFGRICWQPTFIICSAMCSVGFLLCLFLSYRSRLMYTKRSEHYEDYDAYKRAKI